MYLFFLSLLFIKLPPFYLLPFISSSKLFTTHVLAKLILAIISGYMALKNKALISKQIKKNKVVFVLLLFFLTTQSLSIINTKNIVLFITTYSNIIAFSLIFTLSFLYTRISKQFNERMGIFLYSTLTIAVILELLFLFFFYFSRFPEWLVQKEVVDAYFTDIYRGRFWFILNNELFIPFIFISILYSKNNKKINWIILIILTFLATLSNVRTRFLQTMFAFVSLLLLFMKKQKKLFIKVFLSLIIIVSVSLYLSTKLNTFNVINRFANTDPNDLSSIIARNDFAKISLDYIKSSPILGIGLGNYVNPDILKRAFAFNEIESYQKNFSLAVANSPHNIFFEIVSETGILGLFSFLCLILYFVLKDLQKIKLKNNPFIIAFIVSSWTVFIYTMFNPYKTIYIFGWFWFMRGFIEAKQ